MNKEQKTPTRRRKPTDPPTKTQQKQQADRERFLREEAERAAREQEEKARAERDARFEVERTFIVEASAHGMMPREIMEQAVERGIGVISDSTIRWVRASSRGEIMKRRARVIQENGLYGKLHVQALLQSVMDECLLGVPKMTATGQIVDLPNLQEFNRAAATWAKITGNEVAPQMNDHDEQKIREEVGASVERIMKRGNLTREEACQVLREELGEDNELTQYVM
jgi:hypothetical protein